MWKLSTGPTLPAATPTHIKHSLLQLKPVSLRRQNSRIDRGTPRSRKVPRFDRWEPSQQRMGPRPESAPLRIEKTSCEVLSAPLPALIYARLWCATRRSALEQLHEPLLLMQQKLHRHSRQVPPTVDLSTKTVDGSGSGTFTSSITGLTQGTVYYVRAYATNNNRTDYGNQVTFTCCELIQYGLSSSLNAYNNASANSWVEITSSEYSNLVNTVTSTGKYGVNDAGMALTGYNQSWGGPGYAISTQVGATNLGTGVVATTIPANNYVYAFQIQYAGYTSNPSGDKVFIGTSNTTGFSQLGGDLPATTQASTSMTVKSFVLKGASSTVGSSAVYLGFLNTKAHTNYVPGNQYWNSSGFTTGFSLNSTYYTPMQVLATPIKNW